MTETPLLSDRDFELAPRPVAERYEFDLKHEETINPSLWESRAEAQLAASSLAQSRPEKAPTEYGRIPEADAPTYLMAWGNTLKSKREEKLAA